MKKILIILVLFALIGCKKDKDESQTVTDIDGNKYGVVTIDAQTWMTENLRVTKYNNGDPIPNVTDGTKWKNLITGAYCDYNNNVDNVKEYGRLYNWYTISDTRGLAPKGWHVATNADWQTLINFYGGKTNAGCELKKPVFNAVASVMRYSDGTFTLISDIGTIGHWWASTNLEHYYMYFNGVCAVDNKIADKIYGFPVRCIKE